MGEPVYRRVIVKLSGEALTDSEGFGIRQATIDRVAADLVAARALGTSIGVVVGGGNMFRGVEISANGVSRVTGDALGMLATVMNALVLEAALERAGAPARTLSALAMPASSGRWGESSRCMSRRRTRRRSMPPGSTPP